MKRNANKLIVFLIFLPFLISEAAYAEEIRVNLPTGGYYRNRMVVPVSVTGVTYGNSARYRINVITPDSSPDTVRESDVVKPRSSYSVTIPVTLNSMDPGLQVSVSDILTELHRDIISKDFRRDLYALSSQEHFFLLTGCDELEESQSFITIPGAQAKVHRTTVDSGAFDSWLFLESVDCVVVFSKRLEKWDECKLTALKHYMEMGGSIISVCSEGESIAQKLFEDFSGWNGGESIPQGLTKRDDLVFEKNIACFHYGLGSLISFEYTQGTHLETWDEVLRNVEFPIAPTSLNKPVDNESGYSVNTSEFFPAMEISPHYKKTILVLVVIIFLGFLLFVSLLYAVKLSRKLVATISCFIIVSTILSIGIHKLVPGAGIVWRYRNIIERGADDLGRITVFCSLTSMSEMETALVQPQDYSIKMIKGWKEPLLLQKPGEDGILRRLSVGISRPLVLTIHFPISVANTKGNDLVTEQLEATSGELTSSLGEILLRRFICFGREGYKYCNKEFSPEEFKALVRKGDYPQQEIKFLQEFFENFSKEEAFANYFLPPSEAGEVLSNEITRFNLLNAESYGATLLLQTNPPRDYEKKEK